MIVLLDLDGTVWDSEEGIVRCIAHALGDLGMEVPPRPHLVAAIGPPLRNPVTAQWIEQRIERTLGIGDQPYLNT